MLILDGLEVNVPASAEEALRNVYKHTPTREIFPETYAPSPRYGPPVWIDAISINQADTNEKSEQVLMMGTIFSRASFVLVWLGIPTGGARSHKMKITLRDPKFLPLRRAGDLQLLEGFEKATSLRPLDKDWENFCGFFDSRWFSRLWIVQEVALAREVVFYRGDAAAPWYAVRVAAAIWNEQASKGMQKLMFYAYAFMTVAKIITFESEDELSPDNFAFTLFEGFYETTDPHDMIYALLGLTSKRTSKVADELNKIGVAYDLPLPRLYATAVGNILPHLKTLYILERSQSVGPLYNSNENPKPWGEDEFPSWVPQFHLRHEKHNPYPGPMFPRTFNVAKFTQAQTTFDRADWRTLRVTGTVVSKVTLQRDVCDVDKFSTLWKLVMDFIELLHSAQAPFGLEYAFTLCWTASFLKRANISQETWRNFCLTALILIHLNSPEGQKHKNVQEMAAVMRGETLRSVNNLFNPYESGAYRPKTARTYIKTSDKKIGLGSQYVAEGDFVCILFGSNMPFVMRLQERSWRMLGTAYLSGIMDGEYLRQLYKEGRLRAETQTFCIR